MSPFNLISLSPFKAIRQQWGEDQFFHIDFLIYEEEDEADERFMGERRLGSSALTHQVSEIVYE